jgi:CBS domain-containing protein
MTTTILERPGPGPSLEHLRVADAMHPCVVTCPLDTPLRVVAQMMAAHRIHCVIVLDSGLTASGFQGVISDLDLVEAASAGDLDELTARDSCLSAVLTVTPDETLSRAAQLIAENEVTHLVVVEPVSAKPLGVLSTLDVARALGVSTGQVPLALPLHFNGNATPC